MFVLPPCYNAGDTIPIFFDTYDSSNASVTISGLAVTDIEIYKDGGTTQRASDNGYTLLDTDGIDFDGATGFHGFSIDTSDNSDAGFWADGHTYQILINAITVDGQTVVFSFMLALGFLLRPTTAGRTLDVNSAGCAGIDWANIDGPTTSQNLSGTTIKTATDVETDTQDLQTQIGTAGAGLTNIGGMSTTMKGQVNAECDTALADYDGPTNTEMLASFSSLNDFDPALDTVAHVTLVDTCTTNTDMRGTDGANTTTPPTAAAIADQVWEEAIGDHSGTSGSTAEALAAASAAGDPWNTPLPGAYAAGKAGYILGTNLDVAVSTRAESVSSGSGAYVVTVTVDDGSDPLEGVTVRLTEGANNFTALTNASGVATFALDAATYTISMTKVGYQFTPTTIVVTTAADFPKSMTAITVSASSPGFATGVLTCYDEDGNAEQNVNVLCKIKTGPGTAGLSYDSTERTEVSGADGVVQFTNMVIGADYEVWRTDRSGRVTITVPNSASFNIAEVIGKP